MSAILSIEQSLLVRFKQKWYAPIYYMCISCGHLISAHIRYFFVFWKKGLKIAKGQSESVNRRTCGTFTKRNTTKRQTMIYKTLHRKLQTEHSESHSKTSRCPVRVCHERESDCVVVTTIGVNEWLLFNANSAIVLAISWREQVNFQWDDDEVRFVLDQHAELDFIELAHCDNSPLIDTSPHSGTLSWFRANQSLLFLLNAACLAEKTNTKFIVFGLTRPGLEPTTYHTRGEHANHYATDIVTWLNQRMGKHT